MAFAFLNTLVFKYFVLLITAPLWLPFVRALLKELNDALADEGGLFGRAPSKAQLAAIQRDPNRAASPLVSRDFDPNDPRGPRPDPGAPAAGARGAPGGARGAPAAGRGAAATGSGRGAPASAPGGFSKPRAARGFARKDPGRS